MTRHDFVENVESAPATEFEPLQNTVTPEGVQEQAAQVAALEQANAEKERQLAEVRARKAAHEMAQRNSTAALVLDDTLDKLTTPDGHARTEVQITAPAPTVETSALIQDAYPITQTQLHIGERLGKGRHGEVFEATLLRTGRKVVAKRALPGHEDTIETEARAYAKLQGHPSVGGIEFIVEQDGHTYGVMRRLLDLVQGSVEGSSTFKPSKVRDLVQHVGGALSMAHTLDIVHRDVKPSNILYHSGAQRFCLNDFSLAHDGVDSSLSQVGAAGTPLYMAPEVLAGGQATPLSDQYSLAAVTFHLLTRKPFIGDAEKELRATDIPDEIQDVLIKALSKDPQQRYAHVKDFVEAYRSAHETYEQEMHAAVERALTPQLVTSKRQERSVEDVVKPYGEGFRIWIGGKAYDRVTLEGGVHVQVHKPSDFYGGVVFTHDLEGDAYKRVCSIANLLMHETGGNCVEFEKSGKDYKERGQFFHQSGTSCVINPKPHFPSDGLDELSRHLTGKRFSARRTSTVVVPGLIGLGAGILLGPWGFAALGGLLIYGVASSVSIGAGKREPWVFDKPGAFFHDAWVEQELRPPYFVKNYLSAVTGEHLGEVAAPQRAEAERLLKSSFDQIDHFPGLYLSYTHHNRDAVEEMLGKILK